jgi:hypothetical protein
MPGIPEILQIFEIVGARASSLAVNDVEDIEAIAIKLMRLCSIWITINHTPRGYLLERSERATLVVRQASSKLRPMLQTGILGKSQSKGEITKNVLYTVPRENMLNPGW